jgi:hypothetical protein
VYVPAHSLQREVGNGASEDVAVALRAAVRGAGVVTAIVHDTGRLPDFERTRAVADAILYEGYLLYPYRKSSGKNRVRWQFGVLAPKSWLHAQGVVDDTNVAGSVESWFQQTECLLEGADRAHVTVRLRFLQLQAKVVEARTSEGAFEVVESLDIDGQRQLSFDEAIPWERDVVVSIAELLDGERRVDLDIPGGTDVEPLAAGAARIVRRRWPIAATVIVSAETVEAPFRLLKLRVRTENAVGQVSSPATRDLALRQTLIATHSVLAIDGGSFMSLLEPPQWATAAARGCVNIHTFPVLGGEPGARDLVLSSPIILYDHPQIAPESPGDLHDSGEIDEILSLRALTLSDEEKQEARATDPRAAAIVDRVDIMPPEIMERLHGAVRSLRPAVPPAAAEQDEIQWWEPGADDSLSPETDVILINGVQVRRGSRVRLHPRRRGTDAHDMFLADRTAVVDKVLLDVDDAQHLAVTLDDDPAAELHQWYGRFRYFFPEEIEPLPDVPLPAEDAAL